MAHRSTAGRWNPGRTPIEDQVDAWLSVINTPVSSHSVAVMSLKGGAGKTTTSAALGEVYGLYRRDHCIAVDANPDRGTLAQRIGQEHSLTVRDLLDQLGTIDGTNALRRFTHQATSRFLVQPRFEVLASDKDPAKARSFTAEEYAAVHQVVTTFRQIVITDTGTDMTNPVIQAVLERTRTLVLASSTAEDVAELGWETLDTVERRGFGYLVANAVVALQQETEGKQVPLAQLIAAYKSRCRAVIVIPQDQHLAGGTVFDWGDPNLGALVAKRYRDPDSAGVGRAHGEQPSLSPTTKRAYLALAAAVAEDFPQSSPWRADR